MLSSPPASSRPPLPRYGDAFVGRHAELQELLQSTSPLITVVGLGGIGKTRLVLEVAHRVRRGGTGDVILCELHRVRSALDLVHQLAQEIGAPRVGSAPDATAHLARHLAAWSLVVLDGCDDLEPEAAGILDQLACAPLDAPQPRFLCTRRAPLGLPTEEVHTLGPLAPDDAAGLFRVRMPGRPADRRDLVELERWLPEVVPPLGGMPLAIELAAARLEVLPLRSLAGRLQEPLRVLTTPDRGDAHASVQRALEATWDQLGAAERAVLAQACVYEGGFPLDAMEATAEIGDGASALDALHTLVRQGLLRPDPRGVGSEPRYLMHALVTAFVRAHGSEVERAEQRLRRTAWLGTRDWEWDSSRVNAELENLLTVVEEELASPGPGTWSMAAHCALLLAQRYLGRPPAWWRATLRTLEGRGEARAHPVLALRLFHQRVNASRLCLELDEAEQDALEAWERARHVSDDVGRMGAIFNLGLAHHRRGRLEEALVAFENLREVAERAQNANNAGAGWTLSGGVLRALGRLDEAEHHLLEAIRVLAVHPLNAQLARLELAQVYRDRGELDRAMHETRQALADHDIAEAPWNEAEGLFCLATVHHVRGELDLAREHYLRSRDVSLKHGLGDQWHQNRPWYTALRLQVAEIEPHEAIEAMPPEHASVLAQCLIDARTAADGGDDSSALDALAACREALGGATRTGLGGITVAALTAAADRLESRLHAWEVRSDGTGFRAPGGAWVDLGIGRKPSQLLALLLERRVATPGARVAVVDLIAAGWPGEQVREDAARNRLYVALNGLRRAGLTILTRGQGGYALDPDVAVRTVTATPG